MSEPGWMEERRVRHYEPPTKIDPLDEAENEWNPTAEEEDASWGDNMCVDCLDASL